MNSNVDEFRSITSKSSFSPGQSLIFRVKSLHMATSYWERIYLYGTGEVGVDYSRHASNPLYYSWDGTFYSSPIIGWSANTWGKQEIRLTSSGATFLVNDANAVTLSSGYSPTAKTIILVTNGNGAAIYFDWVLARKYVSSEPILSSLGAEEW